MEKTHTQNDGMHHLDEAKRLMRVRDGENAKMEARKYIALNPKSSKGYMTLALAHYMEMEYKMAQLVLQKYIDLAPPNDDSERTAAMMRLFVHREKFQQQELLSRCCYCGGACESRVTCSACKYIHYCSKECQVKHWKGTHKKFCISKLGTTNILIDNLSGVETAPTFDPKSGYAVVKGLKMMSQDHQVDDLLILCNNMLKNMNSKDPIRMEIWLIYAYAIARNGGHETAMIIVSKVFSTLNSSDRECFYSNISSIYSTCNDFACFAFEYECFIINKTFGIEEANRKARLDDILVSCSTFLTHSNLFNTSYKYKHAKISDACYLLQTAKNFLWTNDVPVTCKRFGLCYSLFGQIHLKKLENNVFEPTETREDVEWEAYFDLNDADKVYSALVDANNSSTFMHASIYKARAKLCCIQEKYSDAVEIFRTVIEWIHTPGNKMPCKDDNLIFFGECLLLSKQFNEARSIFEEARILCKGLSSSDSIRCYKRALQGLVNVTICSQTTETLFLNTALVYGEEYLKLMKKYQEDDKSSGIMNMIANCVTIKARILKGS